MPTHEEMIALHASKHRLVNTSNFSQKEAYVLYLMHLFPYFKASNIAANKKVLDLGCNNGYGSEIISYPAQKVVGVDVSEKAISAAKARRTYIPIDFEVVDGLILPFNDNEFDLVVSFQVIEHIVDYEIFFSELKRVLKTGGVVCFTTPNALIRLYPGMKPWNKFHVREFKPFELEDFLSTFFSASRVIGLFAEEPLSSIEKERVDKIRQIEKAKKNTDDYLDSQEFKKVGDSDELERFINKYGVKDFFYRSENLEESLDLLAVCTDDKSKLENIVNEMMKQNTK